MRESFWQVLCMFNFDNTKQNLSAPNDSVKKKQWKTIAALKPILGKILLDKDWLFFWPHIHAKTSLLRILFTFQWPANTLSACINIFGQITVQRYFVFVSTVRLWTLYIQEVPYMNIFCECILNKIGLTHGHFQYNARKLMSLKSVSLWGILREN